jgi:hypothetical protein
MQSAWCLSGLMGMSLGAGMPCHNRLTTIFDTVPGA